MTYNKATDSIEARGNVLLQWGDIVISTDELFYNEKKQDVRARGGFLFVEGKDRITGDEMTYNLLNKSGTIVNGKVFIEEDNYHIWGDRIAKRGENRYLISKAIVTTCDGDSPAWSIKSSEVDVEIGRYLFADHARLLVKKVPIFYTPLLIAPVKKERQTGLLAPKIGYSNLYGFTYKQPFFWAISRNKDATITLNHQATRGTGGDLEYRYVRTKDSEGQFDFKYLKEYQLSNEKRWMASFKHSENFSSSMYAKADLNIVSDLDYLRDYGDEVGTYSSQRLESKASLVKNWRSNSLITEFKHYKNLIIDEDTTLQRLPEVTFKAKRQRIADSPLFWQMDSSFTYFWREEPNEALGLYRGQRLDLHPALSLPITPDNIFELTPKVGIRETLYYTDEKDDRQDSRFMYDLTVDFFIPFSKVYSIKGEEIKAAKHTIEPGFTYSKIPDVDQSGDPVYDSVDNIAERENIRLKLNNYLVTKRIRDEENIFYHRLVDLKIYRDYNFVEADRSLTSSTDERRPWGDITARLDIKSEKDFLNLNSEFRFNTYDDKMTYFSTDLDLKDKKANNLKLGYIYTAEPETRYIDSKLLINASDQVSLGYSSRYSVVDDLFLETRYGIMLTKQCWQIEFTYSHREVPTENKYFVVFNLKGLGKIGDRSGLFAKTPSL